MGVKVDRGNAKLRFKEIAPLLREWKDVENIFLSGQLVIEDREDIVNFFRILLEMGERERAIELLDDHFLNSIDWETIDELNRLFSK
jgi:hypothetical protein